MSLVLKQLVKPVRYNAGVSLPLYTTPQLVTVLLTHVTVVNIDASLTATLTVHVPTAGGEGPSVNNVVAQNVTIEPNETKNLDFLEGHVLESSQYINVTVAGSSLVFTLSGVVVE